MKLTYKQSTFADYVNRYVWVKDAQKVSAEKVKGGTDMKGFKKVMASTIAMAAIAAQASAFAAVLPEEIVGTKYEEPVQVLAALKIMVGDDNGSLRLNDTIKRSEVAKMVVHAMGLDSLAEASKGTSVFPDVPADHWANGYINVAHTHGLVVGDDTGKFRPDARITYAEAVTIFVRAIGYEPVALSKGGYPNGYVAAAGESGIADNVGGAIKEGITRGNVAVLANNSLTAKMMERKGFGQNETYETTDKTLLKDKMEVDKLSGQLSAVGTSSLDGSSSLKKDQAKVDDKVYETAYNINNLLGYNVDYYVKENDAGKDEIILALPKKNSNTTEEISADLFEKITQKDSFKAIEYYKTEGASKTTTALLAKDAKLIYNGKSETMSDDLMNMKDKSGKITLLDTDRDGKYDVVFVSDYFNMVVDEVTSTNKIVDKYNAPTLKLDDEDENLSYRIINGVQEIALSDLEEYDVLSVAASLDKEIYEIQVSKKTVSGKVTGTDEDGYYIDGELYKVASNYDGTINLNMEGKFYLDVFGKIAGVDTKTAANNNYAYLIKAYTDVNSEETTIRLFTDEGKDKNFSTTEKIRFNGKSGQKADEAVKSLQSEGNTTKQLITYSTNSDGKITEINTALDNSSNGKVNEDKFTLNYNLSDAKYNASLKKLGNVRIDSDTVIFDIQSNVNDYSLATTDMFEDEQKYNVMVYDMGENFMAKAIVVTGAEFMTNAESSIAVVDKISQATNKDEEIVDRLHAYQDGKAIALDSEEQGILVKDGGKALETGDIIQYKVNANGEIASIRVLMDIKTKANEKQEKPVENLEIIYGKVVKKFNNSINVTVGDSNVQNLQLPNDIKVYSVDTTKSKNNITVATRGDIQAYDEDENNRVFVKIYKDIVQEVVIIK